MKPIVIYAENKDKITLTRKDFEKYLSEAFDQGYTEGYNKGMSRVWYPSHIWYPSQNTPVTYRTITTCDPSKTNYDPYTTITSKYLSGEVTNTVGD